MTVAPFDVTFVRLSYDIEQTLREAKERDVPDLEGYTAELRTAKYFRRTPFN